MVGTVKMAVNARGDAAFAEHGYDLRRGATFDPRRIVEHRHARALTAEAPVRVRDRQAQMRKLTGEDRGVRGNSHRIVGRGPTARAHEHHGPEIESVVLQRVTSAGKRPPHLRKACPPAVVIPAQEELQARAFTDPREISAGFVQIARP